MAVTVDSLAAAIRLDSPDRDTVGVLTTWLEAARESVGRRAPAAPVAVADAAIVRLAGYWFDQPIAARGSGYAAAWINSGAAQVVAPWIVRRTAGAISDPESNLTELLAEALGPIRSRLTTLEETAGVTPRIYTGYTGWITAKPVIAADFTGATEFQDGIFNVPQGGPGFHWFAVPAAEGYPDIITVADAAMTAAWTRQTGTVEALGSSRRRAFLGQQAKGPSWIVGVSNAELAARFAGVRIGLEYY